MSIFQWLANRLKFKTPKWLVEILREVQNILIQIMIQVGSEYIAQIQSKIIEVDKQGLPNKEKFQVVFNFARVLAPTLKDSAINLLIETLFNRLKKQEIL